jgi:LuxR family maltose regulon positive regulatory protein
MPTHLSFREIAGRTFVSPNTVKTQANAVYRKLGVSGRSEAVDAARACGLLD